MPPRLRPALAFCLLLGLPPAAPARELLGQGQDPIVQAQVRWEASPHGAMLARILPPSKNPATLPEPHSPGAKLLLRYCVQCHHLPNPAMHPPDRWPRVVERMVARMQGKGNLGVLMQDMMGKVTAPGEEEIHSLLAYLRRHAQQPLEPLRYPDLATRGRSFRDACSQCHGLPDPRSRSAAEWPEIVARMERNMAWMNRVVGSQPNPREPQLQLREILAYLQRHSRP